MRWVWRYRLRRWHDSLVVGVALESLCAETMTLPFVLYTFGQMSFIGLPANVLVVTLVPLAMLLSLAAGLAGMLAGWLGLRDYYLPTCLTWRMSWLEYHMFSFSTLGYRWRKCLVCMFCRLGWPLCCGGRQEPWDMLK